MRRLLFLLLWTTLLSQAVAQDALVTKRWFTASTDNFTVISQLSRRQTERQVLELEQWRNASLQLLNDISPQRQSPITTYLYIFSSDDDYALFSEGEEPAYFFSSPRANFIIMQNNESGVRLAKHHYAHFLMNNRTQGLPRWYEEGMSHYLSRVEVSGGDAELRSLNAQEFELINALNDDVNLDELFFDDAALASPRLVQIANFKAAFFMQFLQHAHEREGFNDRRGTLSQYLTLLDQGRTERFAFDQAFELSMRALAGDFQRYIESGLQQSERDRDLFAVAPIEEVPVVEASLDDKTLLLAEISLHSARFPLSAYLFNSLIEKGQAPGRAYSGYADSVRMYEGQTEALPMLSDQALISLYEQAVERSPQDYQLHLDFGQFFDAKRNSCEPAPTMQERTFYEAEMQRHFQQALAVNPENPEVNLSYAQVFLFDQQDWREGAAFHDRAFASLASDTFVLEQAVEYALREGDFDHAQSLINRMARPMHFWGAPDWVKELSQKLLFAQRSEPFDACVNTN